MRVAEYRFEETAYNGSAGEVVDATGNGHDGVRVGSAAAQASGKVCRGFDVPANTSSTTSALDTALDVSTSIGDQGGISFWYRSNGAWGSGNDTQLFDASMVSGRSFHLVRRGNGTLRFAVTDSGGSTLTADSGGQSFAAGTWVHVAAAWKLTNGNNQSTLKLYINGVLNVTRTGTTSGTLDQGLGTLFVGDSRNNITSNNATINSADGRFDELRIVNYEPTLAQVVADRDATRSCGPHHLELRHGSGSALTCSPATLTVVACADSTCATPHTAGLTGTLTATGSGMTVNWPAGASFTIAAGSSQVDVAMHLATVGSVTLGTSGLAPATVAATSCNFGSPSCTFTAGDAGLLFDVPHHVSDVAQTVTVSAVKKADNSLACVPAFASVSKAVTFSCAYANPASGTLPVRVGGSALNASNNAAGACDAGGRAVTLAFDATGTASTTVQYADVGSMTLAARYTGSGSDTGLVLNGSDGFIAAPYQFTVSAAAGTRIAGSAFTGSVTARNFNGGTTPNFGRETPAEGVTLGWARTQPQGAGAVNGSFSGSVGNFAAGTASASNLVWSEVGRGELSAALASGNYLGSGLTAAGNSIGAPVQCADEWGTCSLPAGAVATVYYGMDGRLAVRTGLSGDVWCANGAFGDPAVGTTKRCWYVVTGGSSAASTGAVGPFRPHHFDVAVTPACGAFSYAGQPYTATLTARNGLSTPTTTRNYDGTAATSPNFAKATTLSDAAPLGLGSLAGGSIAASAFTAGVAPATPAYSFTDKLTAPQSLTLRATDADTVSSSGFAEGSMPLRSGRLRVANGYGSEKSALQLQVTAEHWSGQAWIQNSADNCTSLPAAAVVRSNVRDARGASTAAWSSSASAVALTAGRGLLTLGAPAPSGSGSLDLAINLGASTTDQSCLAAHPASTGANLPWLRSRQGACASTWDRDPSARASFGIFSPESRKTVHVREIF